MTVKAKGSEKTNVIRRFDGVSEALVTFDNATIGYGRHSVLSGLSFALHRGGYIGIVGPNGAGKTTLLRSILGTLKPMSGRIIRAPNVRFGYVPQAQTMDEHFPLTVLDIVLMGRYPACGLIRRPSPSDRQRAEQALADVGIPDLAQRSFCNLSGGQRQRMLVARALVSDPDALLLDEPTSDMDIAAEKSTMELLDRLHNERGLLVLMVSHVLNLVVNHVSDVAILGGAQFAIGHVEEMVQSQRLEQLYNMPVTVAEVNGNRVVF